MTTAVTPIPTTSTGVNALLGDEAEGVARGGYVLADAPAPDTSEPAVILIGTGTELSMCVAVELASTFGWERYVGAHGVVIGMTSFGESAPLQSLQQRFGFTPDRIVGVAKELLTTSVV